MLEIHAVTNGKNSSEELVEIILSIADEVDYIHIREKNKKPREIFLMVEELLRRGMNPEKLVINDRLDIAILTGIKNIHLPNASLPVEKVKKIFPHFRVGVSAHSLAEVKRAEADGADYCFFGHIFETGSKQGIPAKGLFTLSKIAETTSIPLIAIGGMTPNRLDEVRQNGAKGVAVMSYIFSAKEPIQAVRNLNSKRYMN